MSKIKSGGLDQYGAEPFQQQQFGTAGVEGDSGPEDKWGSKLKPFIPSTIIALSSCQSLISK